MGRRTWQLFAWAWLGALSGQALAVCPDAPAERARLTALRDAGFARPAAADRDALSVLLVACLGDPDPALRDGVAYEALAAWMRAGAFDPAALRALRERLYAVLDGPDGPGFARPFAALVLSEVARTDRIDPWMSPDERAAMVARAAGYVEGVRDYRGYDDREGWRHGVAHGADWLMQLALNRAVGDADARRILAAVAAQAVPDTPHAYVFGEPARLVRPVLAGAARGVAADGGWPAWFASLVGRLGPPPASGRDRAWLARRHDLVAFLDDAYLQTGASADARVRALQAAVLAARNSVP